MLKCVLSRFVWAIMKETFGWSRYPFYLDDFWVHWVGSHPSKNIKLFLFGLGAVCWALWRVRNKMGIEKELVRSPKVMIFNIISSKQQCGVLLPEEEQKMVQEATKRLQRKMGHARES
jgi:hypothetical protein